MTECHSPNSDIEKIKKFLKNHPNLLISNVDKVKTVCIMDCKFYEKKLNACFDATNFEKLTKNLPKYPFENSSIIYSFSCPCNNAEYIGETRQLLESRVQQHRRDSESNVKTHIDTCNDYQNLLFEMYPNPTFFKIPLHSSRKKFNEQICSKNL